MSPQISARAWTELTLLALIWGAVFLSIKLALAEVGPFTLVLHRVGWAALVLWAYVAWAGLPVPRGWRVWGAFAVMGVLNNALPFTLMSWGQGQIETGLVSIFNATTAVWGVLVAALVLRDERLTAPRLAGALIALAGVAVVKGPGLLGAIDLRELAQFAVLAGTISYAFAGVWAKIHLRGVAPAVSAAGMLTAATFWMAPLALWVEGVPRVDLAWSTVGALAYMTLVATAGAYLLYFRVLAMAGSGNLMLVTLMMPPISILLGAAVLGERLAPNVYVGFAIIALGLMVIDGRAQAGLRRLAGRGPGG